MAVLFSDALSEIKAALKAAAPTNLAAYVVLDSEADWYKGSAPLGCQIDFSPSGVNDETEQPKRDVLVSTVPLGTPPVQTEIQTHTVARSIVIEGALIVEHIEPDGKGLDAGLALIDNLSRQFVAHRKKGIAFVESGARWSRTLVPSDGRVLERWTVPVAWRAVVTSVVVEAPDYFTKTSIDGELTPTGAIPTIEVP